MLSHVSSSMEILLGALGVIDPRLPASYAEGADVPAEIPVPALPAEPRAAAPALHPTPAGH